MIQNIKKTTQQTNKQIFTPVCRMGKFANFPIKHLWQNLNQPNFSALNQKILNAMKTSHVLINALYLTVLILLFSGCSADSESDYQQSHSQLQKNGIISPFEAMGETYNHIYQTYQNEYQNTAASTELIIERVENIILRTNTLEEFRESYPSITKEIIDSLMDRNIPIEGYAMSVLSYEAQSIFIPFLNSLTSLSNQEIYRSTSDFEDILTQTTTYGENDIRTMLTVTTIIKSHIENGDDDDWDNQGTTILKTALFGSAENSNKAVVIAVIARLIHESYQ